MSINKQPIRTNIFVSQDQDMFNNAKLMLEFLAIPYDDNQLANLELWDSLFSPISLLGIKKFLSSDA